MSKDQQGVKAPSMSESERLKKKLKPYGRQILLEQAFRILDSNGIILKGVFTKILLASKQFYWTAKHRPIYRFAICVRSNRTTFGFLNRFYTKYRSFQINFEKASKLTQFLQPNRVRLIVHLKNNETSEFLQLIPLLKGKLQFNFMENLDVASQLVEANLSKIDRLICHASAFPQNIHPKSFEYLSVRDIKTMDELRKALCHNSKKLRLGIDDEFHGVNEPINDVGRIDKCTVYANTPSLMQVARTIVASCSTLKQLNCISLRGQRNSQLFTTDELIDDIVERYNVYKQAVEFIGQLGIKSNIGIFTGYCGNTFLLPQSWMNPLLTHPDFTQINHETEVVNGEVITTFTNDQKNNRMEAKFRIKLLYQYV